jgi:hypothetical protein
MALRVISLRRKIWSLSDNSGHWPALAQDGSVANNPKQTFHRRSARMWLRSRRASAPKPVVRAAKLATLSTVPDHVLCTLR